MVTLKLIRLTDEEVIYEYHPEDREIFGVISFNRITKEPTLLKDDEEYKSDYRCHAYRRIRDYDGHNDFPETGLVAWY